MTTFFVDTNALLRFLVNDIPAQAKEVEDKLRQAKNKEIRLVIPQVVIFELQYALTISLKKSKEDTVGKIGTILSIPFLEIDERENLIEAIGLYARNNIDFVDCFLFCKARSVSGQILSFDKDFKKLGKSIIEV